MLIMGQMCRQFYRPYPIANAMRSQLSWTQYCLLIQIDNPGKRMYYELESVNNGWTARETGRQINSQLYERLLLSNEMVEEQRELNKRNETNPPLTK